MPLEYTQLLSVASCVAHGGRLPDNQHVQTVVFETSELANYSHHICM
jgi:hypothetical protein